jgi:hypothetical protein
MPSPFPGMDPWLENPSQFAGLHSQLVTYAVELLQPQLLSRGYFVAPNERVWVEESQRDILPDGAVLQWRPETATQPASVAEADKSVKVRKFKSEHRQPFLEIFDNAHRKLITGIEFVSPTNKSKSEGRRLYRRKQQELQAAGVNMVEIDLLRRGRPIILAQPGLTESAQPWDYLVCLWRAHEEEDFELYPITLRSRLPRILIPLKPKEAEATLDLQSVFDRAYDAGPYRISVNYRKSPVPPLQEEVRTWADERLRAAGYLAANQSSAEKT